MSSDNFLSSDAQFNQKLASQIFTLNSLEIYLRFVFGSLEGAARAASLTAGRIRQICLGISLPTTPETVNELSRAWNIQPSVLMKVFAEADRK